MNKKKQAKRLADEQAAYDAIPIEVREKQERKQKRHQAKLKLEKKEAEKAEKISTEQSIDYSLALKQVKVKDQIKAEKHNRKLSK